VAETEASRAQRTAALAKDLLSNFTYKEYPGTEHGSVWYAALPAMFDFFDKQGTAAAQGQLQ
jgi:predicted alpha/beta superfamily hydrolase